ncbi:MAG: FecR domain-containing protein, partial [Pseudomonadota bacterium]
MNIFSDRRTVEKRPSSVRRSPRRGLVQTSFLALAAAAPARAQLLDNRTVDPLGEIVDVRGDEEFQAVEQPAWRNAALTQSLSEGDLLRTGPYGGVGIAFEDRTQFRLHATSELKIGPLETTRRRFDLFKGRLWSRASRPDTPLTVRTPSANASIRGTDWYMEVLDDGSTRLSVLSGVVDFSNDEGALQVGSGESAIARRGLAPELEIVVESPDRPRWALKPRADWNGFLPKSDDSAKVNAHLDVIQAFDEVRFTDARATLDAYEARYSDDLASNLLYAYAELYGGRLDDAKARIDRARALDDDAVRPLLLDAQYALLAADDARLDETTAEAVKRAPNAPAVWLFRAQYLALAGGARVAEVQAALERAVALGGAASEPQLALGDFLLAQGRTQEALDAYDRAWAADPNDPAAVSGRAFAYVILERLDDAEALLQPFLAAGTTNPDILSAAGVVDLARARPDAAAAITGKVVAGNPGRPGATLLSGVA